MITALALLCASLPGLRRKFAVLAAFAAATLGFAAKAEETPVLALEGAYTGDIWHAASGGLKGGERYLDNLDLTAALDTGALGGAPGSSVFIYVLANNSATLSDTLVGDAQTVSNIDTGAAVRLYEAWYEHPFAGGTASVKAGLYDLNSEFDAIDTAGLFLNSSHGIGPDFSQSGQNGPSIFPVTSLTLRVQWQATETVLLRAAVLDGVPGDPARPKRNIIKLGGGDGALLVAEVEADLDGTIAALGAWHYTASFDHLTETDALGQPLRRSNNAGLYAEAERKVYAPSPESDEGLSLYARIGLAQTGINQIGSYVGGGAVYHGLFAARPDDDIGLAVAVASNGDPFRRAQALAGTPVGKRETALELTYRATITPWLTLQPDVQYIINPSMDPGMKNALAVGLRFEIAGAWAR